MDDKAEDNEVVKFSDSAYDATVYGACRKLIADSPSDDNCKTVLRFVLSQLQDFALQMQAKQQAPTKPTQRSR